MNPTRICIAGVAGRMGQCLLALTLKDPELKLVEALERRGHKWVGHHLSEVAGVEKGLGVVVDSDLHHESTAQVFIDFTEPVTASFHAKVCADLKIPIIIGTTGVVGDEKDRIARAAEHIPVIHAPNFSVGVNVLFKLVEQAAEALGDSYDVEIVEAHHNQKEDAPSGTALRLYQSVLKGFEPNAGYTAVHGRSSFNRGVRTKKEIGIHAIRMADVVGEHTVYFAIGGERIELTHKASSRDTFARGALRAAKWIVGKDPGMYTMAQVLGLE
ncbi:MAG: 4-hydroxy-tetrahydrodipicolinate reductase [Candidatus Pacebacteria bacterium]|nr:4-hydroxy-tetrahydrodipicolinate reductase [Candidatus Paceibacterota bacterium]MDD5357161.1 4-hydroxy-tetrahydrodipicolinate reductase [Candidatus Paceibacterota bacterium]